MEPDHDPNGPDPSLPDGPLPGEDAWRPPDAPASVTPLFTEQGFENWQKRLARHLRQADDLADRCDDLVREMRDLPALSPVTERLVEAHGKLVTAANTLAAIK